MPVDHSPKRAILKLRTQGNGSLGFGFGDTVMETITFANYSENVNIKFGHENGKFLVLGFLVNHEDFEKRFAINANEDYMETEWRPRGEVWFNKPGTKWFPTSVIPDEAQFIGQYIDDMFATKCVNVY